MRASGGAWFSVGLAAVSAYAVAAAWSWPLKAALFPLYFWLPDAYSSASAPVAALFSIMTKAGVYAILRVYTLVFGAEAGAAQWVAAPWLLPAALAVTMALEPAIPTRTGMSVSYSRVKLRSILTPIWAQ